MPLTQREADVYDAIKRQNKYGGIRGDALDGMFPGCFKVHVSNIRKKLAKIGAWEIYCDREGSAKGFYRIRRTRNERTTAVRDDKRSTDREVGRRTARQDMALPDGEAAAQLPT